MADIPKEAQEKGKRGRTIRIAIAAAIALTLAAAGAGAAWYLRNDGPQSEQQTAAPAATPGVFLDVDPFTVNLSDSDGERFAQVSLILEVVDNAALEMIRTDLPRLRNDVLLLISSRSSTELLSVQGKQALAAEVQLLAARSAGWSATASKRPNPVTAVHYSKFIVQ